MSDNLKALMRDERVLFYFWGRRGALSRFTLDLAHASTSLDGLTPTFSISDSNELFDSFKVFGNKLLPVRTFDSAIGALRADRMLLLRTKLARELRQRRIKVVISLMPHIWSPFMASVFKEAGCRYGVIIHDAQRHPGDPTSMLNSWLMRDIAAADIVFTLSEAVAGRLSATGLVDWRKIFPLFHPDLGYGEPLRPTFPVGGAPLRVLLFGRLLQYKGLPMFLDAIDILRERGVGVEIGVVGEGEIGLLRDRLRRLGATVRNTWIPDHEVRGVFKDYHAVVLSHTEASQSGIVAAAHGLGMPVVVTPVGGLSEQVRHNVTGLIADHADPPALAAAIDLLAQSPALYAQICEGIHNSRDERSMRRFLEDLVAHACFAETRSA